MNGCEGAEGSWALPKADFAHSNSRTMHLESYYMESLAVARGTVGGGSRTMHVVKQLQVGRMHSGGMHSDRNFVRFSAV